MSELEENLIKVQDVEEGVSELGVSKLLEKIAQIQRGSRLTRKTWFEYKSKDIIAKWQKEQK